MRPPTRGLCFHLRFEHFGLISMVDKRTNCCLFVKYSLNICYHKTIHIHVTHKWNCQSLAQHYSYWLESAIPSGPEIKRLFSLPSFLLHFTVALCGILFIFDSLFIGLFLSGFIGSTCVVSSFFVFVIFAYL